MFNKTITETPLTTRAANGYFKNIKGERFRDDVSFIATMRALLHNRIGEDRIEFTLFSVSKTVRMIREASAQSLLDSVFVRPDGIAKGIYLTNLTVESEDRDKAINETIDNTENGFVALNPGFRELEDLKVFTSKYMNARFYINEEQKITYILVLNMNMRDFHFLQMLIPRYLPWYFADKPLNKDEIELVFSFKQRYSSTYEALIAKAANGIDLRNYVIQDIIGDFEKKSRRQQYENAKRNVDAVRAQIDENMSMYRSLIEKLDKAHISVAGLKAMIDAGSGNGELVDFFIHNKSIMPVSAEGSKVEFLVKGYLDTYDPDMYTTMSANKHSHLFNGYSVGKSAFESQKVRKEFLDAIFGEDARLKIKCCAYYRLDIRGNVDSSRGYHFPVEYKDYLPNPHLQHYDCLGNHRQFICECLNRGDMVAAVSQCMGSARSINIGESTTMEKFLRDLFSTDAKIIELPDGNSVTTEEALEWLNNNGEEKK